MKTFAYVGCRTTRERNARGKGIGIYAVDPDTTAWTLLGIHPTLDNPSFLALDDAQAVLYAIHGDGSQASAYRIDAETGRLTDLGAVSCDGRNPVHLALSADGAWLAIANYATGAVTRLPIGPGGALGRAAPLVALPGEPGRIRRNRAVRIRIRSRAIRRNRAIRIGTSCPTRGSTPCSRCVGTTGASPRSSRIDGSPARGRVTRRFIRCCR